MFSYRTSAPVILRAVSGETVRDATFEVLREQGLTTIFAQSRLDRGAVPRRASRRPPLRARRCTRARSSGWRRGTRSGAASPRSSSSTRPPGLGNAVGALATARVNRAPLVVLVGQQDRRHLVFEPFLDRPAPRARAASIRSGSTSPFARRTSPARSTGPTTRPRRSAARRSSSCRWTTGSQPADEEREDAAAGARRCARPAADPARGGRARPRSSRARSAPALVVGAGADDAETWEALVELAERLVAPVFQESFGARAGFPQDHRLFAGFLPADRPRLRERLAPVRRDPRRRRARLPPVAVDAAAASPSRGRGSRSSATTPARCTAARSSSPCSRRRPPSCRALAARLPQRDADPPQPFRPPPAPAPPAPGEPLTASHVLAALAERLPDDAVVVEEAPVDRPELHDRLLARRPLGFLSAAMGGLGFARRPAAAGAPHGAAGTARRRRRRRRLVALRHPGAVERRALRRRRRST